MIATITFAAKNIETTVPVEITQREHNSPAGCLRRKAPDRDINYLLVNDSSVFLTLVQLAVGWYVCQ
ncbi:hypothetical protein A0H81_02767 [Grifola frondosa]|uniref:Uncharacterized protein n=1 Tax=Grifola frondosa TaxID=5627 RepID=A0A1C7MKL6_GRIFR|nr:hypothetical protein A0H81_02767 [Grifola frondosa]